MLCVVMTAFASISNGQERTARIVEVLPDDQFIVEIAGKEYRAINGDKAVELAKQKVELQGCKINESKYQQLTELANKDVTIANQQRDIERQRFISTMALYEKERELRQEAMQFAPVSGTPKGFGGWLLKAVNSPYGAVGFRLVIPFAQFVKVMKE